MGKKNLAAKQAMRMVVCRLAAVRTVPESHAWFLLFLFFYFGFKAAVRTVPESHACSLFQVRYTYLIYINGLHARTPMR